VNNRKEGFVLRYCVNPRQCRRVCWHNRAFGQADSQRRFSVACSRGHCRLQSQKSRLRS